MPKIKTLARPKGQADHYKFFKNDETGNTFKARREIRENIYKQPVLAISVTQTDSEGKAILDTDGTPVVTWHTHTFTDTELQDPAFDPNARLNEIMNTAIEAKETELNSRNKIKALVADWPEAPKE